MWTCMITLYKIFIATILIFNFIMITLKRFENIKEEVVKGISDLFDYVFVNAKEDDYILFLADGEYMDGLSKSTARLNPYVIDDRRDRYRDETRMKFFVEFLKYSYSFPNGVDETRDDFYNISIELMIYCHIWESKVFLKQLRRMACLAKGETYSWKLEVPEMSKHDFIRNEIKAELEKCKLSLGAIIRKGFHSSLRNAFAHSEYVINMEGSLIYLDTYKGAAWDIRLISFNDWSERFVYSALLSYFFLVEKYKRRKSIVSDLGDDTFTIVHPINDTKFRTTKIYYNEESDSFSFVR